MSRTEMEAWFLFGLGDGIPVAQLTPQHYVRWLTSVRAMSDKDLLAALRTIYPDETF